MKRSMWTLATMAALVTSTGCMKPYHEPVLAEISRA